MAVSRVMSTVTARSPAELTRADLISFFGLSMPYGSAQISAVRGTAVNGRQPYILRIANSTICSTAFASNTMRCSPSMSTTKP